MFTIDKLWCEKEKSIYSIHRDIFDCDNYINEHDPEPMVLDTVSDELRDLFEIVRNIYE